MGRSVVERLVEVAPKVATDQQTPFVDWCMMAWAVAKGIPYKNFRDGVSCPTSDYNSRRHMCSCITNHGAVMLHSVKTPIALQEAISARHQHSRSNGRGMSL